MSLRSDEHSAAAAARRRPYRVGRVEVLEARRLLAVDLVGDFNGDRRFTAADIDVISAAVRNASGDLRFDLDASGTVDSGDRDFLLNSIFNTRPGDADLDGDIDANDLSLLQANFGSNNAGWGQGDFDGNGRIDFGDAALLAPFNGTSVIGGPTLANAAAQLSVGLESTRNAISGWNDLFNLTPAAHQTLPGVDDNLADVFNLNSLTAGLVADLNNPTGVIADLEARLAALGVEVLSIPGVFGQTELVVRITREFNLIDGSSSFADEERTLLAGLSDDLDLAGTVDYTADFRVSLTIGVDASGVFLRGDSRLELDLEGTAVVTGSFELDVTGFDLSAVGTVEPAALIGFDAGLASQKIRPPQWTSHVWQRSLTADADVTLDLRFNALDYVDVEPTRPNSANGGDAFLLRVVGGFDATQPAGGSLQTQIRHVVLRNPDVDLNGSDDFTLPVLLENLYRFASDILGGGGLIGGGLGDLLGDFDLPLSAGSTFDDAIDTSTVVLNVDSGNAATLDLISFAELEGWFNAGIPAVADLAKLRLDLGTIDLDSLASLAGDLGLITRNPNLPIVLENARLTGEIDFGLDLQGGFYALLADPSRFTFAIDIVVDLAHESLTGPFAANDFFRLDPGSTLTATPLASIQFPNAPAKVYVADFFTAISHALLSLDAFDIELDIPSAQLLPGDGSQGFSASVTNLFGTAGLDGALHLTADSVQIDFFDELRLVTNDAEFNYDPAAPGAPLFTAGSLVAAFPNRPDLPTGTLSSLTITPTQITIGTLAIAAPLIEIDNLLEIRDPQFALENISIAIGPGGVNALGAVVVTASGAALFPNPNTSELDGVATVIDPVLRLDSEGFTMTASSIAIVIGDLATAVASGSPGNPIAFDLNATGAELILTIPTLTVALPVLEIDGRTPTLTFSPDGPVPGLGLRGDGFWNVGLAAITFPAESTATFGFMAFIPFTVRFIVIDFDEDAQGRTNLNAFDLFLRGDFDIGRLRQLFNDAFEPVIIVESVGQPPATYDAGNQTTNGAVFLKLRVDSLATGDLAIADLQKVTLGINDWAIGPVTLEGRLELSDFDAAGLPTTIGGGVGFVVDDSVQPIDQTTAGDFDEGRGNGPSISGITLEDGQLDFVGTVGTSAGVTTFDLEIDIDVGIRFKLADFFELYGVRFGLDFFVSTPSTGPPFSPTFSGGLRSMAVRKVRVNIDGAFEFTGGSATQDAVTLNFTGSGNIAEFGPLTVRLPGINDIGGTVEDLVILPNGLPNLIPFDGVDSANIIFLPGGFFDGEDSPFGWLPFRVDALGLQFLAGFFNYGTNGLPVSINDPSQFKFTFSGGFKPTTNEGLPFPVTAMVDGLELSVSALRAFVQNPSTAPFPITNFDGFEVGVDPFAFFGPDSDFPLTFKGLIRFKQFELTINGVTRMTRWFAFEGGFKYQDIGATVELIISERGPILAAVQVPLAIVLGPTTLMISGVSGGIVFGLDTLPSVNSPEELLDNPLIVGNFDTSNAAIESALSELLVFPPTDIRGYTFAKSLSLKLSGQLTSVAVAGLISGQVSLVANIAAPAAGVIPETKYLLSGSISVFGMPLGAAGIFYDYTDILAPTMTIAFGAPVPGSPLGFLLPAQARFGLHLTTDGVCAAPLVALTAFVQSGADGLLGEIADSLELDRLANAGFALRLRDLTQLVLDTNNDGTVSPGEFGQSISSTFLTGRLLSMLPTNFASLPTGADLTRASSLSVALQQEIVDAYARVSSDPFASLAQLGVILGNAALDAGLATLDAFNPTLRIEGRFEPTVFGMPVGQPIASGAMFISKNGVSFELGMSVVGLANQLAGMYGGGAGQALFTLLTLGVRDEFTYGYSLDLSGVSSVIIEGLAIARSGINGTNPLPGAVDFTATLIDLINPFANWEVLIDGSISIAGFRLAEVNGLMFGPNPAAGSLFDQHVRFFDPNDPDDAAILNDPLHPLNPDNNADIIPVFRQSQYDAMIRNGGILLTGQLFAPAILRDPVAVIESIDWSPPAFSDDPLSWPGQVQAFVDWLTELVGRLTADSEFARLQMFVPSPARLFDLDSYIGPSASYLQTYGSDAAFNGNPEVLVVDANGNGLWDPGDTFTDRGNGTWDPGEDFTDLNGNGVWDGPEPFEDLNNDGVFNSGDSFTDLNGDGVWTDHEPFVDLGNGLYDGPSSAPPRLALADLGGTAAQIIDDILNSFYVEGYVDAKFLGINFGKAYLNINAKGIKFDAQIPWAGGNVVAQLGYRFQSVNEFAANLLDSPFAAALLPPTLDTTALAAFLTGPNLPDIGIPVAVGFAEANFSSQGIINWLSQTLGVPARVLAVPASPTFASSFGIYTPGVGEEGDDPIKIRGGVFARVNLNVPGFLDNANAEFQVELPPPSAGQLPVIGGLLGLGFKASATAERFGPTLFGASLIEVTGVPPATAFGFSIVKSGATFALTAGGRIRVLPTSPSPITLEGSLHFNADLNPMTGGVWGTMNLAFAAGSPTVLALPGVNVNATYSLRVNTTTATRDGIAGNTLALRAVSSFTAGGFVSSGTFDLSVADGRLVATGAATVDIRTNPASSATLLFRLSGNATLAIDPTGVVFFGTLSLTNNNAVARGFVYTSSSSFTLRVNTTPATAFINGTTVNPGGSVQFAGTFEENFFRVSATHTLTVQTSSPAFLSIQSQDVDVKIRPTGDAGTPLLDLNGSGGIVVLGSGIAVDMNLSLDADFQAGAGYGVSFSGSTSIHLAINTTGRVVNFGTTPPTIGGTTAAFARLEIQGQLRARPAGVTQGGFLFDGSFTIAASSTSLSITATAETHLGLLGGYAVNGTFTATPTRTTADFALAVIESPSLGFTFNIAGSVRLQIDTAVPRYRIELNSLSLTVRGFGFSFPTTHIELAGAEFALTILDTRSFDLPGWLPSFTVDYRLSINSLGAIFLGSSSGGTYATVSVQSDPAFDFLASLLPIRLEIDTIGVGFARSAGTGHVAFAAIATGRYENDLLGEVMNLEARINIDGYFKATATVDQPPERQGETFGIFFNVNDLLAQLGAALTGQIFNSTNIPAGTVFETIGENPASPLTIRIDIYSNFTAGADLSYGSINASVSGTDVTQLVRIPERNDTLRFVATNLPAGTTITIRYRVSIPNLAPLNQAEWGSDFALVPPGIEGVVTLTATNSTRSLSSVLDDDLFEFAEQFEIEITSITRTGSTRPFYSATKFIHYTILNDQPELENTLVYYEFDSGPGTSFTNAPTSIAADVTASDFSHTAAYGLSGGVPALRRSLFFSSTGSPFVQVPRTSALPTSAITMELWLRPGTPTQTFTHPIGLGGSNRATIYLRSDTGQIAYKFDSIGGVRVEANIGAYTVNTWTHVAVTYNGSTVRAYLNGVEATAAARSATGSISYLNNDIYFGVYDSTLDKPYNGRLDEVRIWSTARSASQISSSYNATVDPRLTNLVGYWQFDEAFSDVTRDSTLRNLPGRLGTGAANQPSYSSTLPPITYALFPPFSSGIGLPVIEPDQIPAGTTNTSAARHDFFRLGFDRSRIHFALDEISGTTAFDGSPFGNNGTLSDKSFAGQSVTGRFGKAFRFIGDQKQQINVPLTSMLPSGADPFTVNFHLRLAGVVTQDAIIVDYRANSAYGFSIGLRNAGDRLVVAFSGGSNPAVEVPLAGLAANAYHHFAIEFDTSAGVRRVWINGIEQVMNASGSTFGINNGNRFTIGARVTAAGSQQNPLTGDLDDFAILFGSTQAGGIARYEIENLRDLGVAATFRPIDAYAFTFDIAAGAPSNAYFELDRLRFFDRIDTSGITDWMIIVTDHASGRYVREFGTTVRDGQYRAHYISLEEISGAFGPVDVLMYGMNASASNFWRVENVGIEGRVLFGTPIIPDVIAVDDFVLTGPHEPGNGILIDVLGNDLPEGNTGLQILGFDTEQFLPNGVYLARSTGGSLGRDAIYMEVPASVLGSFEFTYAMTDITGQAYSEATVRVRIHDLPVAVDDLGIKSQINVAKDIDVLANDIDFVPAPLTLVPPVAGVDYNPSQATISLVTLGSGRQGLRFIGRVLGTVTFTYRVQDIFGREVSAQVQVSVSSTPVDGSPSDGSAEAIRIRVTPVFVASPSATSSTTIPAGVASAVVGQSVHLELWASDLIDHVGITGGSIDVNFTAAILSGVNLHRPEFAFLPIGSIDNAAGRIDDFGGASLAGGLGVLPGAIRLGYVQFVTTAAGNASIALAPGAFDFALFGVGNVNFTEVDLSQSVTLNVTAGNGPPAPVLGPGQDTGVSADDGITNLRTPAFVGTAASAGLAVTLLANGQPVGNATTGTGGVFTVAPASPLSDGVYVFTVIVGGSEPSAPVVVTIDTVAPAASTPAFEFEVDHALRIGFSENIADTLVPADIALINLTTGVSVPSSSISVGGPELLDRTIRFPGLPNGRLPDGRYRLSLAHGAATDIAGNASPPLSFEFMFLAGDGDGDGTVNFLDLLVVARHFGQTGRVFSEGNFDYDPAGLVGFNDLLIVARQFGTTLPAMAQRPPLFGTRSDDQDELLRRPEVV